MLREEGSKAEENLIDISRLHGRNQDGLVVGVMNNLGLYLRFAQGRELEHHLPLAIRDQGESAKEPPLPNPPVLSERVNFEASLECVAPLLWEDGHDRMVRERTSEPI